MLSDALAETDARRYAELPDTLANQELELRTALAGYETELSKEQQWGNEADSLALKNLEHKLFDLNEQYQMLLDTLEFNYPEYYNLKYSIYTASVDEVQDYLTSDAGGNATLLSYFLGQDSLYTYSITPSDFHLTVTARDSSLEKQVSVLRAAIDNQQFEAYTQSARGLYKQLIEPVAEFIEGDQLIIVPDGLLATVPFEVLLTEEVSNAEGPLSHRDLPYLLRDVAVRYTYSATLMLQTHERSRLVPDRDLLAFAPVFEEGVATDDRRAAFVDTLTGGMREGYYGALPWTRDEVTQIEDQFTAGYGILDRWLGRRTKVYVGSSATESVLKSDEASAYRYVHLATHGFVNEQMSNLSGLVLATEDTTQAQEDGLLYLPEVYTLNLNAEMVVLSACETGLGEVAKGEGLIGLARGFLYAGAESLVVTLWTVPDQSSKELMVRFYRHLLSGHSKAEALRQAKLELLELRELGGSVFKSQSTQLGRLCIYRVIKEPTSHDSTAHRKLFLKALVITAN